MLYVAACNRIQTSYSKNAEIKRNHRSAINYRWGHDERSSFAVACCIRLPWTENYSSWWALEYRHRHRIDHLNICFIFFWVFVLLLYSKTHQIHRKIGDFKLKIVVKKSCDVIPFYISSIFSHFLSHTEKFFTIKRSKRLLNRCFSFFIRWCSSKHIFFELISKRRTLWSTRVNALFTSYRKLNFVVVQSL